MRYQDDSIRFPRDTRGLAVENATEVDATETFILREILPTFAFFSFFFLIFTREPLV